MGSIENYQSQDTAFYNLLFSGFIDSAEAKLKRTVKDSYDSAAADEMRMILDIYRASLFEKHGNRNESYRTYGDYLKSESAVKAANPVGFFLNRPYRISRLTSNSYAERHPRLSPENDKLAFIADVEAESFQDGLFPDDRLYKQEIRIMDIYSGEEVILFSGDLNCRYNCLQFTPDGDNLLYTVKMIDNSSSDSRFRGRERIEAISLNQQSSQINIPDSLHGTCPIITPDGKLIFAAGTFYIMDLHTGKLVCGPSRGAEWFYLIDNFDYENGILAFRGFLTQSRWQIGLTDTAFNKLIRATGYYEKVNYPALRKGGNIVAYIKQGDDYSEEIYLYFIDDSTEVRISDTGGNKSYLSFSEDGSKLIFAQKPLRQYDSYYDIFCIDLNQRTSPRELIAYLDSMN